ncbi:hypothetical protein BDP81DRAFT_451391 [Colletotrichum phormii]|uniref:Uncharacterized protein n=1 Tax=Colletotrichum phormii TaxID=359342 RepID=A0AAI9ZMY2_9PEZI|nr:uncharacterized protein BDP81DRAFT_451391 [Colletotrichum phormii]KAK1634918.1 hypothetical protein BDP81DRAFT_451391 [Colletotrichum phormii]
MVQKNAWKWNVARTVYPACSACLALLGRVNTLTWRLAGPALWGAELLKQKGLQRRYPAAFPIVHVATDRRWIAWSSAVSANLHESSSSNVFRAALWEKTSTDSTNLLATGTGQRSDSRLGRAQGHYARRRCGGRVFSHLLPKSRESQTIGAGTLRPTSFHSWGLSSRPAKEA